MTQSLWNSRACGTDPSFPATLHCFSIRKTKGNLLKAASQDLNSTGGIAFWAWCSAGQWPASTAADFVNNKWPPRLSNIRRNQGWISYRGGGNLSSHTGCTVSACNSLHLPFLYRPKRDLQPCFPSTLTTSSTGETTEGRGEDISPHQTKMEGVGGICVSSSPSLAP